MVAERGWGWKRIKDGGVHTILNPTGLSLSHSVSFTVFSTFISHISLRDFENYKE